MWHIAVWQIFWANFPGSHNSYSFVTIRCRSIGVVRLSLSLADFNALVDGHGAALYRIAYRLVGDRHEAEDMVQETFRSAWKSRANFEAGRGDRAWLVSILRRRTVDRWPGTGVTRGS